MNAFGFLFSLVTGGLIFTLPRRWAAVPLLVGAAYMTRGQVLDLGPFHFPVIRILVVVGFARVVFKGEQIAGGMNAVDRAMVLWAVWLVCSSVFHSSDAWVTRLGIVSSDLGSYFLFRVFVQEIDDVYNLFKVICVLLAPLAVAMLLEKVTGKNYFAALGGVWAEAAVRDGHLRAQGPFAHAILAGTVGAACLPMALLLWRPHRKLALTGLAATLGIVFASGSSGPVMTVLSSLFVLALWKVRGHLRKIRWFAVLAIVALALVMHDPVYYLLARIDITGGSTGWHRAALIDQGIKHLDEWWLAGTDYTRHWMPTGIHANEIHTDMTNHFLQMGVWGGLPLLLLFMAVLFAAFAAVGKALHDEETPFEQHFLIWSLGSILFGHVTSFFGISYYDQSVVFLYFVLAIIGSLQAMKPVSASIPASAEGLDLESAGVESRYEPDFSHHH